MNDKKNILITGGNRGIGFGLLKILSGKHNVIITVRDNKKGENAISKLDHSRLLVEKPFHKRQVFISIFRFYILFV